MAEVPVSYLLSLPSLQGDSLLVIAYRQSATSLMAVGWPYSHYHLYAFCREGAQSWSRLLAGRKVPQQNFPSYSRSSEDTFELVLRYRHRTDQLPLRHIDLQYHSKESEVLPYCSGTAGTCSFLLRTKDPGRATCCPLQQLRWCSLIHKDIRTGSACTSSWC